MTFNITSSEPAFKWLQEILRMSGEEFIRDYIHDCNKDLDFFLMKHLDAIKAIDIDSTEFIVFHVTSNSNQCAEIKQRGIINLQKALTESCELSLFLKDYGFQFDIQNKKMIMKEQIYDINYGSYQDRKEKLSLKEKKLQNISRKIYSDYQINGFFFSKNIFKYGTYIDRRPEFL